MREGVQGADEANPPALSMPQTSVPWSKCGINSKKSIESQYPRRGKGTRMRELTSDVPEADAQGQRQAHPRSTSSKALSERWDPAILHCHRVQTGVRGKEHFGDGARWNASIEYVRQLVQDGTGKAPELAKEFVAGDSFILTYGDILIKPTVYQQMITRFNEREFAGLVTVTAGQDVTKGGINFFETIVLEAHRGKAWGSPNRTVSKRRLDPGRPASLV